MRDTITWLHLSDLHACQNTNWNSRRVTTTLVDDLKRLQHEHGLRPDLIFFTGDAAFGNIGTGPGQSIHEQFRLADDFLSAARKAFDPPLAKRDVFLVPGNHDVNIAKFSEMNTEWLRQPVRTIDQVTSLIHRGQIGWRQYMERLSDYAMFLRTQDYEHLLAHEDTLFYADAREINGRRIGIAGFNSAWSSTGEGLTEMGRLWCAGNYQLEVIRNEMGDVDCSIALIHHPANWLVAAENPDFGRRLERDFAFVLHGHEHSAWVRSDQRLGHSVISAGACYERQDKENGYNMVRLDFQTQSAQVWLRQFDSQGGAWIPRIISQHTDTHGTWQLQDLRWMLKRGKAVSAGDEPHQPSVVPAPADIARTLHYDQRFCEHVATRFNRIQLFGIDVPRESKEYSLSIAYVSLDLADDSEEDAEDQHAANSDINTAGALNSSICAEDLLSQLANDGGRLLIAGSAGCGKTTLLRWAAVQAATSYLNRDVAVRDAAADPARVRPIKLPFIIKLRDFPEGQLPRASELFELMARHLPDPPAYWIDTLLLNGNALIMFDGVDEVPPVARDRLLGELRDFINAYPQNAFIVTTRPEAFDLAELQILNFRRARIEPMSTVYRDRLIDRWHSAMEERLRTLGEPEDLRPLSQRLKARLSEALSVSRLTSNPLLCAVVCAVHRQRNENLPETPVELCEALCRMLLHRRERERPGLSGAIHEDEAYRQLEYAVRKGLVSTIAHAMVCQGVSAMNVDEVEELCRKGLESYGKMSADAHAVTLALIERSGMLQEAVGRVEFLHNTLKEYLAAERFVNDSSSASLSLLAEHASDPAWQPVILFTLAMPRDGSVFATQLLRHLLTLTSTAKPTIGRSKIARMEAASLRSQQFFLLRCRAAAYQLSDPKVIEPIDEMATHLFPPHSISDGEALAACGETIVPYLRPRGGKATSVAACIRALRLIGGPGANALLAEYLEKYGSDDRTSIVRELSNWINGLELPSVLEAIATYHLIPHWVQRELITSLEPLVALDRLTRLHLYRLGIADISPLERLSRLEALGLNTMPVSDIGPLARLEHLQYVSLDTTHVSDIAPLASISGLAHLELTRSPVRNLEPIERNQSLSQLIVRRCPVVETPHFRGPLRSVSITNCELASIASLQTCSQLVDVDISATLVSSVSPLVDCKVLRRLDVAHSQVRDLLPLSSMPALSALRLSGLILPDFDVLRELSNLEWLDLSNTSIKTLDACHGLQGLRGLDISNTEIADITPLRDLKRLEYLSMSKLDIHDLSVLRELPMLAYLELGAFPPPAQNLSNLRLKELRLETVAAEEFKMLQKVLPECRVHVGAFIGEFPGNGGMLWQGIEYWFKSYWERWHVE